MTAHRNAPDPLVFGENRSGVFLPPSILGAPTDPAWCARCGWHVVEKTGRVCPLCEGER